MKANSELREKMWELCYDLLPADERKSLVGTIKSNPQAARLYAEVRLQADLVGFAAKVEDSSLLLSPEGQESSKRDLAPAAARRKQAIEAAGPPRAASLGRGAWVAWLPAAAALLLVGLIGWGAYRPWSAPQVASSLMVTEVEMPGRMLEGLSSKIALRSHSLAGLPQRAEMDVKLVNDDGEVLHREVVPTDANGLATVTVPGQAIQPGVRFEAIARQQAGTTGRLSEQVRARGAMASDFLAAALPVEPQPPVFYVLPERPTAQPGESMRYATYNVSRFGLQVQAVDEKLLGDSIQAPAPGYSLMIAPARTAEEEKVGGVDDAAGSRIVLEQLEDQNRKAKGRSQGLPNLAQADKYLRGIQQLSGVADAEEFSKQAKDADLAKRQPAPAERDGRQASETLPSETQLGQEELRESAEGDFGSFFDRSAAPATQPLVVDSGSPVPVEVPADFAGKDGQLIVRALVRGVEVASAAVRSSPEAPGGLRAKNEDEAPKAAHYFQLEVPPEADGEIQVQVVDASQRPPQVLREQVVVRRPTRHLRLSRADSTSQFQPGEDVQLRVRVLNEHDQPEAALLGVRVWSESHIQASGQEPVMVADVLRSASMSPPLYGNEVAEEATRLARLRARGPQIDDLALAKVRQQAKKEDALVRGGSEALPPPPAPPGLPAPASPASRRFAASAPAPASAPSAPPAPAPAIAPVPSLEPSSALEALAPPAPTATPPERAGGGEATASAAMGLGAAGGQPDAQTYAQAITPAVDAYVEPQPLVVSNEAAVRQESQLLAARSERAWQAWQAIVGRVLVVGGLAALGGLLLLFLVRMPVRAANGTLTLVAAAASLVVGAFWASGGPRQEVQIAAVQQSLTDSREESLRLRDNTATRYDRSPASGLDVNAAPVADQPMSAEVPSDRLASSYRYKEAASGDFAEQSIPATEGAARADSSLADNSPTPPWSIAPANPPGEPPAAAGLGGLAPAGGRPAGSRSGGFGGAGAAKDPTAAAPLGASGATRRPLGSPADRPAAEAPDEKPEPSAATRDRADAGRGRRPEVRLEQGAAKAAIDGVQSRLAGVEAAPASLYFNPRLVTDAEGYATIEFQMPEVESDYRVLIDAFGQGRIGSAELSISCRNEAAK